MNKLVVKLVLALIIALSLWGTITSYRLKNAYSKMAKMQVSRDSTSKLLDSTRVRLASTSLDKDSLSDALRAANILNGRLVAAAKIKVKPGVTGDSVRVVNKDSSQTFVFSDTTVGTDTSLGGVLDGTLRIIPAPDDWVLNWTFTSDPLNLTVSVIEMRDNSAVFAVKYRGGETQIEAPFARLPRRAKFITTYAEGLFNPFDQTAALRAGVQSHIPFLRESGFLVIAEGEQKFRGSTDSNLYIGIRKVF